VKESCGRAEVEIERVNGADGRIEIPYKTKDQSAIHGKDFIGGENVVVFEHGETQKSIFIDIIDDKVPEKEETCMIELLDSECKGVKIGRLKRTVVTIVSDDEYQKMFDRVVNLAHMNMGKFELGTETWGQQFVEAMNVNGGDVEHASPMDYAAHLLTFAWKVIFACVPPVSWAGGWLAFVVLISLIGLMTAVIGDLATIFGCLIGLEPEVTAITFVALGTSLPDLFASRNAAMNEKYADASIGNVTGSNGVNVFLGLGIPWVMAAAYWEANNAVFKVNSGALGTSVVTYVVCALAVILLLIVRRFSGFFGKGELGGSPIKMYACGAFMIFLWLVYVLVSAMVSYKKIAPLKF
jgi:solute carrier family 8 (sodium/calcium exchanger)